MRRRVLSIAWKMKSRSSSFVTPNFISLDPPSLTDDDHILGAVHDQRPTPTVQHAAHAGLADDRGIRGIRAHVARTELGGPEIPQEAQRGQEDVRDVLGANAALGCSQ